ncbi:MAG: CCA tRNA nucleotidyltransferase [Patescibacteria group bacterium]|nr:CCA tRNA nucleotidyltransferase [Patescibacteria group bacterium]
MTIPNEVKFVLKKLNEKGFEAYIVGGCVRDFLRGQEPQDWDIATIAKPEQIGKIFLRSFTDNNFGTIKVQIAKSDATKSKTENSDYVEIEITPYRTESKYTNKRHPDEIKWAENIEQDLGRRDFTVNAIAGIIQENKKEKLKIIDLFGGEKDLKNKIIRAVGNPDARFNEDALRIIRAVRFCVVLGKDWKIEAKTAEVIKNKAGLLRMISKERIRDEFLKIIMSEQADKGIDILHDFNILKYVIPELEECRRVGQNKHHIYDVYTHLVSSLEYAVRKNFNKYVRIAALFHDIGKPRTKRGTGENATFYNHEIVSARMCFQILTRLRFPRKDVDKITKLVRWHLFYYNVDEVGEASVRRLVRQVGSENIEELLQLRFCDRIGSGVPKAEPYKLRHMKYIIEKISKDPISVKTLKISGKDIMKILDIKQSPKVGAILNILLEKILQDPKKNNKEFLEKEAKKAKELSDLELYKLSEKAQEKLAKIIIKDDAMTKKKYWVS